jgi:hypothetical protein
LLTFVCIAVLGACTGSSGPEANPANGNPAAVKLGAPGTIDSSSLSPLRSPPLKRGIVVREPGRAVLDVALSADHLVWEAGPLESEKIPVLRQRDLQTGRVITFATDVLPDYGLAATRRWVVYASQAASGRVQLNAVRYDGSGHVILSDYIAAPLAARGDSVGWAEVAGSRFDVFVKEMTNGPKWLAASLPRCPRQGCYRIDAVTLAEGGIVFDMGAIGPQPSRIVRRTFSAARPASVAVPRDSQPDLVPSSAGALYYWFNHGWYAWDFGDQHPRATTYGAATAAPVLRFQDHHFFLTVTKPHCESKVVAQSENGGSIVLQRSELISRLSRKEGCPRLTGLTLAGRQVIVAWAVGSDEAENNHTDAGLLGLVVAGPIARISS